MQVNIKNNSDSVPTIQERNAYIPSVARPLLAAAALDIDAYEKNIANINQIDEVICALLKKKEKAIATDALLRPKVEDMRRKFHEVTSNTYTPDQIREFEKTVVDKRIIDDERYLRAVKLECDFEELKSSDY